mmetsp:Transcript_9910/g.10012  ORF Transcript_9910/g.10012 Transcript_9910/m.10012 type:complete len:359 (+) Transcript_9910:61-1137(+)
MAILNSESGDETENETLNIKRKSDASTADNKNGGEDEDATELKRTKRKVRRFDEDVLIGRDGIERIYEEFPKACKFQGRGFEALDLKRLTTLYKEWAFQLFPNLAFEDLLSSTEKLGAKGKVRTVIENLRTRERERYMLHALSATASKPDFSTRPPHDGSGSSVPDPSSLKGTTEMGRKPSGVGPDQPVAHNSSHRGAQSGFASPSAAHKDAASEAPVPPSLDTSSRPLPPPSAAPTVDTTKTPSVTGATHPATGVSSAAEVAESCRISDGFLLSSFDESCLSLLSAKSRSGSISQSQSQQTQTDSQSQLQSQPHPAKEPVAHKEEEAEFDLLAGRFDTDHASPELSHSSVMQHAEVL